MGDNAREIRTEPSGTREIRTLIAVPCMATVHTDFMKDFVALRRVGDARFGVTKFSMLHDARNTLAANAIQHGYDRVLWIDSDMRFESDLMERLAADMMVQDGEKTPLYEQDDDGLVRFDRDYIAALAFKRVTPTEPVVYDSLHELPDMPGMYGVHILRNYPHDQLFKVAATGFGCVMTSTRLLKQVWDKFGPPFSYVANLGEDMSFCWKVGQLGIPMYCDSRVKVGHIGEVVFDEEVYMEQKPWE